MKTTRRQLLWAATLGVVGFGGTVYSQITANQGDGVLNAPYRGTIDSLRECSADIAYGEVQSLVEPSIFCGPKNPQDCEITSSTVDVWVEGTWDRSVLRMYEGLDASGDEVDFTDLATCPNGVCEVITDGVVKRFSFKAIGTKTLAPQAFTVRLSYTLNGAQETPTRTVAVAPISGSFCALRGESEAFLLGTPILDVVVGNARLTVPVGRTTDMIGAAFIHKRQDIARSGISTNDVLFPGAAETVHVQNNDQFRLFTSAAAKADWGTPWPGYLVGYQINVDPFGPDGTHYDSLVTLSGSGLVFRRVDFIRPLMQGETLPASVKHVYDNGSDNHVIAICDHPTPTGCDDPNANVITLTRTGGVVTGISTSDGRSWSILPDPNGWIAEITPTGTNGKRSFTYNPAGRVTQVKDGGGAPMYEFTYINDGNGNPTILTEEKRFVDNAMQIVVQHQVVSESLQRRKEFTGPGEFRQFDFNYDNTANNLRHRLASITSYGELNTTGVPFTGGAGTPYTTTYTHDVSNAGRAMVITQVDLPDGTRIDHEYDSHVCTQPVSPCPNAADLDFGFRTRSTRTRPGFAGSLTTFDVQYEYFYPAFGTSGSTRLFYRPRIVRQRDGRGPMSEVTFDYDNGGAYVDVFETVQGHELNRLLAMTGPTISQGTSGLRTPLTEFLYDDDGLTFVLEQRRTRYGGVAGAFHTVDFTYDPLLRLKTQKVDATGENILTQFLYCDSTATQGRITVDPDGYWTRTRFDNSGRVTTTEQFLEANAGNVAGDPCAEPTDPAEPVYRTTSSYNTSGFLLQTVVENKDQDGQLLTPNTITTMFSPDLLGRVTLQTVDSDGIGQESNFDYNWLGETERQFDTSKRGSKRTYDGRGLVKTELPLAVDETPDTNLTTTFTYDAMGNLRFTNRPTGATEERVYDHFDRLAQIIYRPNNVDGGAPITTTFEYNLANHVTRTFVEEGEQPTVVVLSDTTARFDEGGFNYESRQRTVFATDDDTNDPLTQRKFDWTGSVIEEKSLGDPTVADRVITTVYDGADRVYRTTDNLGGETTFTRDDRGNVIEQSVKIDAGNLAVTTKLFDALSRPIQITSPEDGAGRPDRVRRHDSRGNLVRETLRDAADVPKLTTVFGYDNAGRQTRQAVLSIAASTILASVANLTTDRVVDSEYDSDGRLTIRRTYNNNVSTALISETSYDDLGRVDRVTDPSTSFTDDDYAATGRLSQRVISDGAAARTFTFGYDGHDRVKQQTALGLPNLVTLFSLDGLDRQRRITDPKGIATRTDFDLVGRRKTLVEDEGIGQALNRQTDFTYNRLSQLITQTAHNKSSLGLPLADQLTTYRYDSLGRQTRIVYPDSAEHANPSTCTDCVRQTFDLAGRMTQRVDQQGVHVTAFAYDDRGLLLTRTTGTNCGPTVCDRDTFEYDAVGRMTKADRGTTSDADLVSHAQLGYTDLGDLSSETQAIPGSSPTPRTVNYVYDQAGNRKQLTYPGGEVLAYTPTGFNQVDAVSLNAAPLLDYVYQGRSLVKRQTFTAAPGGSTLYEYDVGYDGHRRVNAIANRFQSGGGSPQTVVSYNFTHDNNGNPITQTAVDGAAGFASDDRAFTVDRLNRLTGTEYFENGQVESTTLDRVGNREFHTDRAGTVTSYGTVNAANEYASIGGIAVTYDAAGNIAIDQAERQYSYDELNRLKQAKNAINTVLANYTYDALGRRITFEDPAAGVTTRYYYDGQSVIEERNAADTRVRYHVNGNQFVDERVATFTQASSLFSYYLANNNFSVVGTGNADGTNIERLDYSSTGDFAGGGPGATSFFHDADSDLDIDLRDVASLQRCFKPAGPVPPGCLDHNFDTAGLHDNDVDLSDHARFVECFHGPFVTPDQACGTTQVAGMPSASGVFTLHGRQLDILDGHGFIDFRARTYDPAIGRWLQRDPLGYADGSDLYEAFRTNPLRFRDPFGRQGQSEDGSFTEAFKNLYYLFLTPEGIYERATAANPITRGLYRELELQVETAAVLARRAEQAAAVSTGVVGTVGGVAEASVGVVLFFPSYGSSAAFILHGADVTQANVRQALSADFTPTLLYQSIAEAGYPTTALVVDVGISLSSGISAAGLAAEATLPIRGIGTTIRVAEPQTIIPLSVTSPTGIGAPNLTILLQRLATQESAKLAADLSRAKLVLSLREYGAGTVPSRLNPARFGQALERLIAIEIRENPLLRTSIDPVGVGRRGPDILGIGPAQGLRFDITTASPRVIAEHLARPYGQNLILITYERPTTFTVFPP